MLIKNLGSVSEHWGPYMLPPGEWGYLPTEIAISGQLDMNPNFQCLKGALENKKPDVVIFSGCSMTTTGGGQQPAQIAKTLQAQGCRVLYAQTGRARSCDEERLVVVQDAKLFQDTAPTHKGLQAWDETLREFSNHPGRIALFTFPSRYLLELAQVAWMNGYKTAYWCLDDWAEINRVQGQNAYQEEAERQMVGFCDHALATAGILADKLQPWTEKTVQVIPNGFSRTNFPRVTEPPVKPDDLRIGEKTLVYWGELQGRWFDVDLVEELARLEPTWHINLIGPNQWAERRIGRHNVHYLGEKPVSELYRYGYYADCGLIPFKQGSLSEAVNPIKAYEYLACNLPIVSIPIPELDAFPYAFQVPGVPEHFRKVIRDSPDKSEWQSKIDDFLSESTWEKRVQSFLKAVQPCSGEIAGE